MIDWKPTWEEIDALAQKVREFKTALEAISSGRAQIPDKSTIFMNGKSPLIWKELNKRDMQELAIKALEDI